MIECSNCNNQIPKDSKFCPSCGNKVEQTLNLNQGDTATMTQTSSKKGKKYIVPIAIVGVIILAALFLFPKIGGDKPEKVVYSVFESIDKMDTEKFLDALSANAKNELLYYVDFDMSEVANGLYEIKQEATSEFGANWLKQINVSLVYKDDYQAMVNIFINGESEKIQLIKEDKKWKIVEFLGF